MQEVRRCNEFHPTRYEMMELARFWGRQVHLYDHQPFPTPEYLYVMERLNRIMDVLGEDLFSAIMEDIPTYRSQHWPDVPE